MAQAPGPQDAPALPADDVNIHQFSQPMPVPLFPEPPPMVEENNAGTLDDFQDPMDIRKDMGQLTPGQIMNVPTPEQIFGLAEKPGAPKKELMPFDNNGNTNTADSIAAVPGLFAEPAWANAWSGNTGNTAESSGSSNTTDRASGFFSGFFDSARIDNVFGNHHTGSSDSDTLFGPSQPAAPAQQSSWDSSLASSSFAPAAPAHVSAPAIFTTSGTVSSSPFGDQSPFTPPQVSSMDTLPKLPELPSLPGQNEKFNQPAAATPSWGPKPPPWTQPQTPFGTPVH